MMHAPLKRFLVTAMMLLMPAGTFAATAAETLTTPDTETVTRGEFIRSAVILLGVSQSWKGELGFSRPVPKALQKYVGAAKQKGALTAFGKDLLPGRGITRGEASQVLVALKGLTPRTSSMRFTDMPAGSAAEKAAIVVTENGWLQPVRKSIFGADRMLSGKEARDMLRKASGEANGTSGEGAGIPTVTIEFGPANKPLQKQDLLKSVWDILNEEYLYKDKLDADNAAYQAVEGLVQSLKDPYTVFMPPAPAEQFRIQLEGEVTGIGAQVEFKNEILTIVSPLPGSPAQAAGLEPGDQIVKVNGEDLAGLGFVESVAKVRGPKGSIAKLTIRRNGALLDISVTRDVVRVPEIDVSWQGRVAVVTIAQFGERTEAELRGIFTEIQSKNPTGVILDLRNDPGGLLEAATVTLSNFLPKGSPVAHIVSRTQEYAEKTENEPTLDPSVPMAVLVNNGSASASEIVAGALQDAKRAVIVGEKTFGKGTVQQILEFRDGSSLKMTVAEWLTPLRRKIDGVGITPDVVTPEGSGRDDQLLKALETLR